MSSLCAKPRAITSPSLQIRNYLMFGHTQVQELVDTEFGVPLPIAHVMWYFDTLLHHLKKTQGPGYTAAFAFIDHQPDLACKIDVPHMYLLGASTNSASDWVNRVQNQLNHILTRGSKLGECGDSDQQANWTNHGIPLWVRDENDGSNACELKEEEIVQNGQAAETPLQQCGSQLVRNLPPRRRRLLLSATQGNQAPLNIRTRAMEMKRRRARKTRSRNHRSP